MEERERRQQEQEQQQARDTTSQPDHKAKDSSTSSAPREAEAHLHFWVLVLPPQREVTTPTFVEPTTGQVMPLGPTHTVPYVRIHAVFDHTNYWACVKFDEAVSYDMFDLSERSVWLPLVEDATAMSTSSSATTRQAARSSSRQQEQDDGPEHQQPAQETPRAHVGEGSVETGVEASRPAPQTRSKPTNVLKVPKSWARPITITKEALTQRFPRGWREEVYRGAAVRRYSPFSHQRGATLVLTFYSDDGSAREVREEFEHREDGLVGRVSDLQAGSVVESFAKTRRDTLKRHQYWRTPSSLASRAGLAGMDNPSQVEESDERNSTHTPGEEVFMFHSKFRVDALRSRTIGGTVWREEFDERPDLLLARSVTFISSDPTPPRAIQKIEEEFGCPVDVEPHLAVQRRVFQLSEGRILLVYHYGRHRLLQPTRSFLKPSNGQAATALTPEMTHGFQPDPSVAEPAMPQLWATLQAEMEAEGAGAGGGEARSGGDSSPKGGQDRGGAPHRPPPTYIRYPEE
ncbi:dynein regulatory complex subunit 7 [Panulirus ornatus]|uniref:dynein regulatory complex subunit 7 n=1 Tax=Panulirus ornatus TaxID=150431 RepID=UPI003A894412